MNNKIFLLALLVGTIAFGFWLRAFRMSLPMDRVMPSGAIVYVDLNHVEKHITEIRESNFGKSLLSIDWPEVMTRNHFPAQDIHDVINWQKDIKDIWGNPLMRKFLSREIAIGVVKKQKDYSVFVALRLSAMAKIAESVGQLFHEWPDGVSLVSRSYHGFTINSIVLKKKDLQFSYVRLGDLLIAAPKGSGRLEDVVDTYQRRQPPLADDSQFAFVKYNAYPKADALVFFNMNLVADLLQHLIDLKLENYGYQGPGLAAWGVSYLPGEISKYKMIADLNKNVPADLRKTLTCTLMANDSLQLVPPNAIAYHWSGCYDFQEYWQALEKKMGAKNDWGEILSDVKEKLEKQIGLNIKTEVLPILGHEAGAYLTDIDMEGKYPFPRALVFIKIKDHSRAQHLLDKLQLLVEFHSEDYQGVKINYITLPFGSNMDPGYGFVHDYLLAATSRQLLKLSIDAYSNSLHSLVSDDVIKQFNLDTPSKFHSMTLMKTAEVAARAEDFLGWYNKHLASQVTMAAAAKQDGTYKQRQIDQAIADKNEELVLAHKKLDQLKSKTMADVTDMDAALIMGTIANLSREETAIRQDILTYKEQKQEMYRVLDRYATRAQMDKLTMFNMENILSPVLKGLESIDAQAVTVRFNSKIWETEILVK